jgi:DMSO reductase anchor subunit
MVSVLRKEWPLAAFTFLVPVLLGLLSTAVFTDKPPSTATFLGISVLAAMLSLAHLGKKTRAWRAILHLRSSWLSREISLFSVLAVVGAGYLALSPGSGPVGWLALAAGFATLMSIDRVYAILPLFDGRKYHSASALLTGLFLVGVFSANPLVAGSVGAGKLILYVQRKIGFQRKGKPARLRLSGLRIAVGLLVPVIAWAVNGGEVNLLVVVAVLFGEMIDRMEFYAELDIVTPEKQMTLDLHEAIS